MSIRGIALVESIGVLEGLFFTQRGNALLLQGLEISKYPDLGSAMLCRISSNGASTMIVGSYAS